MLNTSRFRLASFNKQPQSISRKPQLVQPSIGTPRTAPLVQYVITLSGTLEFTTRDGETFVLRPGEVLLAADTTGTVIVGASSMISPGDVFMLSCA